MKNFFNKLFGRTSAYDKLELRFHKQANVYGEHGVINVTHVKQGLVETGVRFVFIGVTTPPKMDRNTMNYIWEEALAQGYIPHYIESYGNNNEITTPIPAPAAEVAGLNPPSEIPAVWRGRGEPQTQGERQLANHMAS